MDIVDKKIFELVIEYFRAPHRYPELSNVGRPLPGGLSAFLEAAVEFVDLPPDGAPDIWVSCSAEERRSATVFFVKNVMLVQGGDYYRYLGLDRGATGDDIRRHFHALTGLMTIGSPDDRSNWDENSAIRINEAYSVLRQPDKRRAYDANQALSKAPPAQGAESASDSRVPNTRPEPAVTPSRNKPVGGSFLAKHLVGQNAKRENPDESLKARAGNAPDVPAAGQYPDASPAPGTAAAATPSVTNGKSEKPFQQFLDSHFDRAEPALTEEELRRLDYVQARKQEDSSARTGAGATEMEASEAVTLPDLRGQSVLMTNEAARVRTARIAPLLIVSVSLAALLIIVMYSKYSVLPGLPDRDGKSVLAHPGGKNVVEVESGDPGADAILENAGAMMLDTEVFSPARDIGLLLQESAAGDAGAAAPDEKIATDRPASAADVLPQSAPPAVDPPVPVKGQERSATSGVAPPAVPEKAPARDNASTTSARPRESSVKPVAPDANAVLPDKPAAHAAAEIKAPTSPAKGPVTPSEAVAARQEKTTGGQQPLSVDISAARSGAQPLEQAQPAPAGASLPAAGSGPRPSADSGAQQAMSQQEVDGLLGLFLTSYRAGDISGFLQLFSSDVRTNGRSDLDGIRRDYQNFFGETERREFVLSDMHWNLMETAAAGQGKFNVGIRYKGDVDTKNVSGTITFLVERRQGTAVFTEMFHSYQ